MIRNLLEWKRDKKKTEVNMILIPMVFLFLIHFSKVTNLQATQCSDTIWSDTTWIDWISMLFSASPLDHSLAHTVRWINRIANASIITTYDPWYIYYKAHSSKLAENNIVQTTINKELHHATGKHVGWKLATYGILTRLQNNLQHKTLQPRRVITLGMEMARCHFGGYYWRISTTCLFGRWSFRYICIKQVLFILLSKQCKKT